MLTKEYIELALVTESRNHEEITARLADPRMQRMLHAAIGMCTEAAELLGAVKKYVYYGKSIDFANVLEELGDCFWYQAIMLDATGLDSDTIMQTNISKLKCRYGEKFNAAGAINRDLGAERAILEDGAAASAKRTVDTVAGDQTNNRYAEYDDKI